LYSKDATATGRDSKGNAVMTIYSDAKTTYYSFSYADIFDNWAKIAIHKEYESANGVWTDEQSAKFTVFNDYGEEVAWITTDSTGYGVAVDSNGLEAGLAYGIYYVRQTECGNSAENTSFMEEELVILTKSDKHQIVEFEAKNPSDSYEFKLTKLSDDTGAPVADATYTIIAAEDILSPEGKAEYVKGDTVATLLTDVNGQSSVWIPYGQYYIEETESPYNFVKNTEKVQFALDASGITVSGGKSAAAEPVTETDDDGNTVVHYSVSYTTYDTPVYGSIYVTKDGQVMEGLAQEGGFSYTSQALAKAKFALYASEDITDDAGNAVWEEGELIAYATTDDTGAVQFLWDKDGDGVDECPDFYMGEYYVMEIEAPEGYVLDTSKHGIGLTWDKTPQNENNFADAGSVGDEGESFGSDIPYESSGKNVLMMGSDLNELIKEAVTVSFTWISPPSGVGITDVSHDGDESVVMWNDGDGNYFISTQDVRQAVIFNGDSSHMFDSCKSLKKIAFDCVDTSMVCDMSYMFYMCTILTELDLTNFDTTNVGYFDYMFCGCISLVTIYVREPNGTGADPVYSEDTDTTGITAASSGNIMDGNAITWEDFSFVRLYTADYIVEDAQEDITLSESDIASVTPSAASQSEAGIIWIDESTYTLSVQIVLSESCQYYCKDGSYSNVIDVTVTVEIPTELEAEANESPAAELALSSTRGTVSIEVDKDDENGEALAGAVFTLYANCDIVNGSGVLVAKAGDAIMESETLGESAPLLSFDGLPTDIYAVDKTFLNAAADAVYCYADGTTGSSPDSDCMFYVKETTVPAGYKADEKTYYLSGTLSDYENGWKDEDGDGIITYRFTAVNTGISYLTLQKVWNDFADTSKRPEYVVFKAESPDSDAYIIVMYEDKAYAFSMDSTGKAVYSNGVTSRAQLKNAMFSWNVKVTYEKEGASELEVWSVVFDNDTMTAILASSGSASPFTADSGYTFAENEALLTLMAADYEITSEGWTDARKLVWRAVNKLDVTEYVAAEVTKTWDDHDNENRKRPDSITVTLYQKSLDGTIVSKAVEILNANNDWTASVGQAGMISGGGGGLLLERYDSDGNEYTYYWEEDESELPEGYSL
ncbi:MAG: Cna B-type domain-containing protein, partial [Clostridiales bacterium]|nr:Cna B-type domain-containing protein [Clostridiales bacterium]